MTQKFESSRPHHLLKSPEKVGKNQLVRAATFRTHIDPPAPAGNTFGIWARPDA